MTYFKDLSLEGIPLRGFSFSSLIGLFTLLASVCHKVRSFVTESLPYGAGFAEMENLSTMGS